MAKVHDVNGTERKQIVRSEESIIEGTPILKNEDNLPRLIVDKALQFSATFPVEKDVDQNGEYERKNSVLHQMTNSFHSRTKSCKNRSYLYPAALLLLSLVSDFIIIFQKNLSVVIKLILVCLSVIILLLYLFSYVYEKK